MQTTSTFSRDYFKSLTNNTNLDVGCKRDMTGDEWEVKNMSVMSGNEFGQNVITKKQMLMVVVTFTYLYNIWNMENETTKVKWRMVLAKKSYFSQRLLCKSNNMHWNSKSFCVVRQWTIEVLNRNWGKIPRKNR